MNGRNELRIGLALGSGSARGWSHIGIINELAEYGVVPEVVCGTSVGAMVAASWLTGRMEKLQEWALAVTKFQTARFLDINARFSGFVDLSRVNDFFDQYVAEDGELIEDYEARFGAVATELETARELWLTDGPLNQAVWASMSLPGLFPAHRYNGKWLIDGGLVNPVPISVCRALGANFIIAVNLNGDIVGKHFYPAKRKPKSGNGIANRITSITREYTQSLFPSEDKDEEAAEASPEEPVESKAVEDDRAPGLFNAIAGAINITQDRITRSRMAGDPPDILLVPRLGSIGLLELYRGKEAMEEGRQCVRRMLPEIERMLELY